jgi:hypothetical protein
MIYKSVLPNVFPYVLLAPKEWVRDHEARRHVQRK